MSKQLTLKLYPPRPGKSPFWQIRGTYLGQRVDRSSKARERKIARQVAEQIESDIERGLFAQPGEPTFASAAVNYMNAGGDRRPINRLLDYFGDRPLRSMTQEAIDAAALEILPAASPATRNREVYTPISAILKHAGERFQIRRPKGARGRVLLGWLWPEQAARLFAEADKVNAEFGLLLRVLCYTGMRLSEALYHFRVDGLRLSEGFAFIPKTKNGNPRPVYFPAHIIAALQAHPRGIDRKGETVFRFHKGGALYDMLRTAARAAEIELPERQAFHLFRHTYGTWMRRYGGLDSRGLVGTGAWDCEQSANRYAHTIASEEARRADMLPVGGEYVEKVVPLKKAQGDQ